MEDLKDKNESDPKWIKDIAYAIRNLNFDVNNKEIRELFFEYLHEGLSPKDALNKAKSSIESNNLKK